MAKGKARRGKEAILNIADFKTTDTGHPAVAKSWGGIVENDSNSMDSMALPTSSTHFVEEYRRNCEEWIDAYIEAMKTKKEYRLSITKLPMDVTDAMIRKSLALDDNTTILITPSQQLQDETILSPMASITFRDPDQFRSLAMEKNPIKVGNSMIMVKLMDKDIRNKNRGNRRFYNISGEYSGLNSHSYNRKPFNNTSIKLELGTKYGNFDDKPTDNPNHHFKPRNRETNFNRFNDNIPTSYEENSDSRKFTFGVVSHDSLNSLKQSGGSTSSKLSIASKSQLKLQFGTIDRNLPNTYHKNAEPSPTMRRPIKSDSHPPVFKLGTLCPPSQKNDHNKS